MTHTVDVEENPHLQVTDAVVDPRPPDELDFSVEGAVRLSGELLGAFAGSSFQPVQVELAVDGPQSVQIDLAGEATLRLESIDVGIDAPDPSEVGVEVPESSDVSAPDLDEIPTPGLDDVTGTDPRDLAPDGEAIRSSVEDGVDAVEPPPAQLRFSVSGTVWGVSGESVEAIRDADASIASISFAVEDATRSDGGREPEVLVELSLFGFGVVVYRDGTFDVGRR